MLWVAITNKEISEMFALIVAVTTVAIMAMFPQFLQFLHAFQQSVLPVDLALISSEASFREIVGPPLLQTIPGQWNMLLIPALN